MFLKAKFLRLFNFRDKNGDAENGEERSWRMEQ